MRQQGSGQLFFWGLLGLLAFAPFLRGSQPIWAAQLVTTGVLGLFAVVILRACWDRPPAIVWSRQDLALVAGLLWVWIGLHRPASPPDAFDAFLILLGCAGCFFLARTLACERWAVPCSVGLCAIGGAVAFAGLLQMLGIVSRSWWDPPQFMAATFVNHNHFAAYLELLLPLGCAVWIAAPLSPSGRFLVALSSSLMAVGFILSCSRGAWISLTLAMVCVLGWYWLGRPRRVWYWRGAFVVLLAALGIGFLASQSPILVRGMSLLDVQSDTSFQTRKIIWQGTWEMAQEHPILGHGLGSFFVGFPRHQSPGLYGVITHAFNEYLQTVVELGLVGLALVGLVGVLVLARIVRLVNRSKTPWKRALGMGGLIGMTSVAMHSLVDYPAHVPAVALTLATVAGLLTGIQYHADPAPLRTLQWTHAIVPTRWLRWLVTSATVATLVMASRPLAQLIVADVWAERGRMQRETGKLDAAIASFQHATRQVPWRTDYHRRLGESLSQRAWQRPAQSRRAEFRQAAEAYRKALALVSHDAPSAHALGQILKATGDVAEADRWFVQAATAAPHNPLYWKHAAELKLLRGDATGASWAFRRAGELAKPYQFFPSLFEELDNPEHFIQVGESALLLGRVGLAQTAFTIASQWDPAHPGAQVGLALCALHRGEAEVAERLSHSLTRPIDRAKWFAGVAQYHLKRGRIAEARAALEASLQLDASNVLARHLQLVLAPRHQQGQSADESVTALLTLNRPPVFVQSRHAQAPPVVVWEPESGSYGQGKKVYGGWALFNTGSIRQQLVVPPGRVRFRVVASGKAAGGQDRGPTMAVSWNGRLLMTTTVQSGTWTEYEVETEVKPGESLLAVDLVDDLTNPLAQVDRNLKLEKVIASWETL